jgi:hypothetical protein
MFCIGTCHIHGVLVHSFDSDEDFCVQICDVCMCMCIYACMYVFIYVCT